MRTRRSQSSTCLQGIHLLHIRNGCVAPRSTGHATCSKAPVRTDETHALRQTLPLHRRLTPDATEPWPSFAHHMTPEQISSTRCMPSHDGQSLPVSCSRDYTGDHRPWWRTAHGWVGKRGGQELWTDLAVAVPLSVVNRGGEEVRIDRLRRPAAQASRLALAIVPQHTGTPHTPTALNCLLCCCLLRAFLLVLLRHCILPEPFCTLQHATQTLHTHSNTFDCSATILRRKHPCVFLVTRLTSSLCPSHSFLSCARFQHYVSLDLSWQGKRRV
jgi:hypothetical protein